MSAKDVAKAFGYLSIEEVEGLHALTNMLPDRPVVVNVGAGTGTSGLAIAETRSDVELTTVDKRKGDAYGGLENERHAFDGANMSYPIQILGDSREVAREWDGGDLDMVFIDDGHKRSDIEGDILEWMRHVKPGGIMAFHDYGSDNWPAVKEVIDEYFQNEEPILHIDSLIAFVV